mmetsp:Transcript_48121/g.111428  ORF Transcript_48121/g.111428 Transcript_48121/m.111428 type:complete len:415 (-) Transcript_48121:107-1351(-)
MRDLQGACTCAEPFWQALLSRVRRAQLGGQWLPEAVKGVCEKGLLWLNTAASAASMARGGARNASSDCASGLLSLAALCAMLPGWEGQLPLLRDRLEFVMHLLPYAVECLDESRWPFTTAELLENYYDVQREVIACSLGISSGDCNHMNKQWDWLPAGRGRLPGLARAQQLLNDQVFAVMRWMRQGIPDEMEYWRSWFEQRRDGSWIPAELSRSWALDDLCNPLALVKAPRILNAGSGPVVPSGLPCGSQNLHVTSADGLAHLYWRLYDALELSPPQLPVQCLFEELSNCFPSAYFHVAHVRNALDHALDPRLAIHELLTVTRRGGRVVLRHFLDEAKTMRFTGMHSWSFLVDDTSDPPRCSMAFGRERLRRFDFHEEFSARARVRASLQRGMPEPGREELGVESYAVVELLRL